MKKTPAITRTNFNDSDKAKISVRDLAHKKASEIEEKLTHDTLGCNRADHKIRSC